MFTNMHFLSHRTAYYEMATLCRPKGFLPIETNGFINYITFGWLTTYMWQVYKKGIQSVRGLQITKEESAEVSAQRSVLENLCFICIT